MVFPGRIGLGTLRLPAGEAGAAAIRAALDRGILLIDTARAYGESEALLGEVLAAHPSGASAFVVTKGGMARPEGGWRPDGRASALRRDCEASLAALKRPIDLYLVHAPDPRVKWSTTVRALARLLEEGLVRAIGLCNVALPQLDAALAMAPIAAVQVAFSLLDDQPIRSGVFDRCRERSLALIAHSPLGGPRRARSLLKRPPIVESARRLDAPPAAVALAALLDLDPVVTVIPGARTAKGVGELAAAARLTLDEASRTALAAEFAAMRPRTARMAPASSPEGEVVMIMGLPGAGKSELAQGFVADGFERLNRDALGGSLSAIAARLEEKLGEGSRRIVLDNTYLTRAARAEVLSIAARRGVAVRGIFIDLSLADAQFNVVTRMLRALGRLPTPEELRRARDNLTIAPTSLWRLKRTLEPPSKEEGFTSLEVRPFVRAADSQGGRSARFVTLEVADSLAVDALQESFVIGWAPQAPPGLEGSLAARCAGVGLCRHGGGPPICWCRPPLPGLLLALAHAQGIDLSRSTLCGTSRAHRELAAAVGAGFTPSGEVADP